MPLITLDDACLAFGHVALLDKAAFQLDLGERVALIGRNGSGKSSLLKALAGQATLDDGRLWRQPGAKVAYVPQEADFPLERSVFATVADGLGDVAQLLVDYHAAMLAVADDASEAALARPWWSPKRWQSNAPRVMLESDEMLQGAQLVWANMMLHAVADQMRAENLNRVLYPNDSVEFGHELRLKQQYLLAACSLRALSMRTR